MRFPTKHYNTSIIEGKFIEWDTKSNEFHWIREMKLLCNGYYFNKNIQTFIKKKFN